MDKSFNDDELSDIMKEIEALEEDLSPEGHKASVPETEVKTEVKEDDPKENIVSLDSSTTAPHSGPHSSTSMSFKVEGNLKLELFFDIGGKVVSLEVTDSGLSVEMEGGVKFSVPVTHDASLKKVA